MRYWYCADCEAWHRFEREVPCDKQPKLRYNIVTGIWEEIDAPSEPTSLAPGILLVIALVAFAIVYLWEIFR